MIKKFRKICFQILNKCCIIFTDLKKRVNKMSKLQIKTPEDLLNWAKKNGVFTIPVNIELICEALGFAVQVGNMSEAEEAHKRKISGALVLFDGNKDILVNEKDIPERQRFTIAHELAHYFLHHKEGRDANDRLIVSYRGYRSMQEAEADSFAAKVLMPEAHLLRIYDEIPIPYITALAAKFNVSRAAMRFRLTAMGKGYIDL